MGAPADANAHATRASSVFTLRYAPALDGVRALAIALVALYNAETPGFWGGFIGVRLFFVLSGFLITSLLLERLLADDTIRFGAFYVRRFERLFPPLLVVLLAFLALRVAFGGVALLEPSLYEVVFAASYIGNWTIIAFHSPDALGHAWSLAVEEQFYFLWPLLLWLAWRVARGRGLAALATLGILAAAAWRSLAVALVRDHPQPVQYLYYATDVCAFGFLIGAGLAIAAASRRGAALLQSTGARRWAPWATTLALLALLLATRRLSSHALSTYGVGLTAVELACAVLIAGLLVPGAHPLKRLFEWAPAVWLGRLSYSLYLVHWPIVRALLETNLPAWQRIPLSAALSLGAAWLLYALVERRLLARSARRGLARP
ncbi:MAG: acyltransferase [Mizugakiibacter sp.]|uniref:acyltransferase family protein n=1 Tax=Mizugakiibacter sp. TaxID=1972610 RepID=UPI0031C422A0|nr:acyltransferase [Xanthomonadaceae bacterium]